MIVKKPTVRMATWVKTQSSNLERLHSLDGFYSQDIEALGHDSSHCFTQ